MHASYLHATARLKNGGVADSAVSDGYADDIEKEANSYFHQLFSGEQAIDVMIQMLARFKESSEKRYFSSPKFVMYITYAHYYSP